MSVDDDGDVIFSGTNLLIQNGSEASDLANAKGNLILGYNSAGLEILERTGSHNVIIGDGHAYTSTGGLVSGEGTH